MIDNFLKRLFVIASRITAWRSICCYGLPRLHATHALAMTTRTSKGNYSAIRLLISFCLAALLTACATNTPKITMNITAVPTLNPDVNGVPSPLMLTIYQLSAQSHFLQTDFPSLSSNAGNALGNELVDQGSLEILPGDTQTIAFTVLPGTHYLGVVGAYRAIDQSNWRQVLTLPSGESHDMWNIQTNTNNLVIQPKK